MIRNWPGPRMKIANVVVVYPSQTIAPLSYQQVNRADLGSALNIAAKTPPLAENEANPPANDNFGCSEHEIVGV